MPEQSWPTLTWATAAAEAADPELLDDLVDEAFDRNPNARLEETLGLLVAQRGRIVIEQYAEPFHASKPFLSWSCAKSFTHALIGLLVHDGLVDIDAPALVPEWTDGDPRAAITWRNLLEMRSGLQFIEVYEDGVESQVIEMLFKSGQADVGHYAASLPLAADIDTVFNYSSGTTNIVCRSAAAVLGEVTVEDYLTERLFDPIGISDPDLRFDESGTWIGSSYLYLTARDFARFGELYRRDGVWENDRILPEGWTVAAGTITSTETDDPMPYGSHWWSLGDAHGSFVARGYEGQAIVVVPALDLVICRFGKTVGDKDDLFGWYGRLIDCFADT
jgi:CubicO group peptidase (beta-lactamase class C family)